MVLGVRVHGSSIQDVEVAVTEQFRPVPVPNLLGIPLLYKTLPGTGGDDSAIRSNIIVRFMADPDDGFAPMEWQYGGARGPAPPVVLARRDRQPFSSEDWAIIDEYISDWLDELSEAEDNRVEVSARWLTPAALRTYIAHEGRLEGRPSALLSLRFPMGSVVVAEGLSTAELNGVEGDVAQYSRERVGVRFPDRGIVALKPERLKVVREAPHDEDGRRLEGEPDAKKQDRGESKQARQREIERQEALVISRRFIECLHEDTFPEMGDLHLFGVGTDYHPRAQEVLAVWQGAAKCMGLTAEELADALQAGNMPQLFEETCKKLAESRTPNAPYAFYLLQNKFAAVEWDTL